MGRRKYSDEFKLEAVRLTEAPGVTQTQIAAELGINPHMLGRWIREIREEGKAAFPGKAADFLRRLAVKYRKTQIRRTHVLEEFQLYSGGDNSCPMACHTPTREGPNR